MKKLSQILTVLVIVLAPIGLGNNAFAEDSCSIKDTGPGSSNECNLETELTCHVNEDNNLVTVENNDQTVASGISLSDGSTGTGSATSGSADNTNQVTYNVTVTDEGCTVAATTVPIIPAGGSGAVTPPVIAAPVVLPLTSGDTFTSFVEAFAGVVGVGAILSVLAPKLYRRWQV